MTVGDENNKRRRIRLAVRCCVLAIAVVFALPILPWSWTSLVLPSMSSHILICSAVSAGAISVATVIGIPVLAIVLFRRRWFCRYGCPVGLLAECTGKIRSSGNVSLAKWPSFGRWAALLTLGGALFGYPLLMWMDPLAIFQGVFTLWTDPRNLAGLVSAIALLFVLGISWLIPGSWCLRICPLGATQELLAMPQRFWKSAPADSRPSGAKRLITRRSVVSSALGLAFVAFGAGWARAVTRRSSSRRAKVLRPPSAVDDESFVGLCMRCGNCLRSCPVEIIQTQSSENGIAGFLTPTISFTDDYCREDCVRCTEVCPSGAIARTSLEDKPAANMGLARVDASLCLLYHERECDICAKACPYEAIRIVWNEEEYVSLPQVFADSCPGCGACEFFCPGTNDWERENSDEPIPVRKAIEVFR